MGQKRKREDAVEVPVEVPLLKRSQRNRQQTPVPSDLPLTSGAMGPPWNDTHIEEINSGEACAPWNDIHIGEINSGDACAPWNDTHIGEINSGEACVQEFSDALIHDNNNKHLNIHTTETSKNHKGTSGAGTSEAGKSGEGKSEAGKSGEGTSEAGKSGEGKDQAGKSNIVNGNHSNNLTKTSCVPYRPGLSANENPFYYTINQLLYYAHMQNIKAKNP